MLAALSPAVLSATTVNMNLEQCLPLVFSAVQQIGEGTFSKVYSAFHTAEGITVAVKVAKNREGQALLEKEASIMRRLSHCKRRV